MQPRLTTIEDLLRFAAPSYPRLSPDGRWLAYVVKTVDEKKNRYETQLWLAPTDLSFRPRPLTFGESIGSFQWMPDSQSLLFVRAKDKKSQIWQLRLDGGEAQTLTALPAGGIGEVVLVGDILRIFTFKPTDDEWTESASEKRKAENLSSPPRVIERLRWRGEGAGWLPKSKQQLHAHWADDDVFIHESEREWGNLCVSPDGEWLAYTQNVGADPDQSFGSQAIFIVSMADLRSPASEREVAGRRLGHLGPVGGLCWSPDGTHLAFLGHDSPDEVWGVKNNHLWLVEVVTGESRDLTPDWDVTVGDVSLGEVYGRGDNGPVWESDTSLLFVGSDRGEVGVYRVGIGGGVPERVTPAGCSELGFSYAAGKLATLRMSGGDAGQVYLDGQSVSGDLTRFDEPVRFIEPIAFTAGDVPCFALIPEGDGPHPTVLYIHGGPHLMYGRWQLFHEYQALAAAGFVVLYPNPCGSKGYGEAWCGAIRDNWGEPAMADGMACVDYAIAQGWSDPQKLAVMGGSYGGYLTGWIIGQTDRFACAIAERGVYNLQSFGGTTDFVQRDFAYFSSNHTDDTESFRRNSPLTYAGKVKTPVLIVHSEGDLRCPVSQADEYFRAVKKTNPAETLYLRYGPEANHELSRGGPPDLRIDRQRRFHDWLKKYLKPA